MGPLGATKNMGLGQTQCTWPTRSTGLHGSIRREVEENTNNLDVGHGGNDDVNWSQLLRRL